jgi:hypothetical protein
MIYLLLSLPKPTSVMTHYRGIQNLNRNALKCEIETNNSFVVSRRKQELEELLPYIGQKSKSKEEVCD